MTAPQQEQQGNGIKPLEAYIAYLAHQHSDDQVSIAGALALALFPLWTIQRFTELDRSTPLWLSAALPTVKTAYLQSQRTTAVYAENLRFATLPTEDPLPMVVPDVELPKHVPHFRFDPVSIPSVSTDPEQPVIHFDEFPLQDVATSLTIQGNYEIKAQMPGSLATANREQELMHNGLTNSSGAAIRQTMNGSRNVTNNLVRFDRRIIGYARVTDSNPCYFCALLASRGTVYTTTSTQGGRAKVDGTRTKADTDFKPNPDGNTDLPKGYLPAKVHDHCKCTLRPVYAKSQAMDADAQFYLDQWNDITRKWYWLNNSQQIEKFKEDYVPFERPAPVVEDIRQELQDRASALTDAGYAPFSPQMEWTNRHLSQLA